MRLQIVLFFVAVSFLISCSSEQPIIFDGNQTDLISPAPRPTPSPSVTPNDKGEYIRPTGWTVPSLPEVRNYKSSWWSVDGRKVRILSYWYFSKAKVTVEEPFAAMGLSYVGVLFDVTEYKTKGKKPFCYRIATARKMPEGVNGSGALSVINIRDADGDGIFETLGRGCPLPDWAK